MRRVAGVMTVACLSALAGGFAVLVSDRIGLLGSLASGIGLRPFGRAVRLAPSIGPTESLARWRNAHPQAMALLVIGQSQAANFAERAAGTEDSAWVLVGGRVIRSGETTPGAEGTRAGPWAALAARLRGDVLFAPAAVGGTTIAQWAPGGAGWPMIVAQVRALQAARLPLTAVLVMVGEADAEAGTSADQWQSGFLHLRRGLRELGVSTPIHVTSETRCFAHGPDETIRGAQAAVVNGVDVLHGPDLDSYDHRLRWDGCHLSREGMARLAEEWAALLAPER